MNKRLIAANQLLQELLNGRSFLATEISSRYGFDSGRLINDIRYELFVPIPSATKTHIYRMDSVEIERYHNDRKAQISECKQKWFQQEYRKMRGKLLKMRNRKGGKQRLEALLKDVLDAIDKKPPSE